MFSQALLFGGSELPKIVKIDEKSPPKLKMQRVDAQFGDE